MDQRLLLGQLFSGQSFASAQTHLYGPTRWLDLIFCLCGPSEEIYGSQRVEQLQQHPAHPFLAEAHIWAHVPAEPPLSQTF